MKWSDLRNMGNRPEKRRYHDDMDEYMAREKRKTRWLSVAFAIIIFATLFAIESLFDHLF
ncbi:MAG TPA: hypothetical protein DCS19_01690 [Flavobacterium sp.]|nr:hypothetical protein [Flavobacterium sp.]